MSDAKLIALDTRGKLLRDNNTITKENNNSGVTVMLEIIIGGDI